ncbi:MAG: hypothetical protein ACK56I_07310, partial [bacterium]
RRHALRDGVQVQVPVHDEEGAQHPAQAGPGQPQQRLAGGPQLLLVRLRGRRVVEGGRAGRVLGQVPEAGQAAVEQVHHRRQVARRVRVGLEPRQELRPLEQQVVHRVAELAQAHVRGALVHQPHPLVARSAR